MNTCNIRTIVSSANMLKNEFLVAKICFDTAENELPEVEILTIDDFGDFERTDDEEIRCQRRSQLPESTRIGGTTRGSRLCLF